VKESTETKLDETLAALESVNVELKSLQIAKDDLTKTLEETRNRTTEEINSLKENHGNEKETLQSEIISLHEEIKVNNLFIYYFTTFLIILFAY